MNKAQNPIITEFLRYLTEGKTAIQISAEKTLKADKKVTFTFADGTSKELQTKSDHNTFLSWWTDIDLLISRLNKVRVDPP